MVYDKRVGRTKYSVRRLVSSVDGWKISDCGKDECVIEYVQIGSCGGEMNMMMFLKLRNI